VIRPEPTPGTGHGVARIADADADVCDYAMGPRSGTSPLEHDCKRKGSVDPPGELVA